MITDNLIMRWFRKGFMDYLDEKKSIPPDDAVLISAYKIGITHASYGDDMPSIDYKSDEEILTEIKNHC